jgi:protein-S-isoprenylcysteine O-methyltransferase Ste14
MFLTPGLSYRGAIVQQNLETTQSNMQGFKDQINSLSENINGINRNLKAAQVIIGTYQDQLKSLQTWMTKAIISMPGWITTACVIFTFFILWLILIQVAIMLQAISVLTGESTRKVEIIDGEIPPI